MDNKLRLLIGSLVIAVSWLCTIIIFFPGTLMWDSYAQLNCYFGIYNWSNHHPAFVTLLMGGCMSFGRYIFKSDNMGVFIYVIFQMTITWTIVIKMLKLILNMICKKISYWITVIYFAFFSVWSAYIQCEVKDTLFFAFVLLYVICLIEIVRDTSWMIQKKSNTIILVLSMLLMCLYRNNGIYVLLLSFPVMIFWNKKNRKYLEIILASVILIYYIFMKVVFPVMGVSEGSKAEMLSIPFQQTARYVKLHSENISQKEKEVINAVLEYDELSDRYNPIKSDPVKETYKGANLSKEEEKQVLSNYFKVWLKELKKDPICYLDSTLINTYGYFSPQYTGYEYGFYMYENNEAVNTGYFRVGYNKYFERVREKYVAFISKIKNIPGLKLMYSCGTYSWIIIFVVIIILIKNDLKKIIPIIPVLVIMLICIASPVNAYIRYYLPVMASVPLLVIWGCFEGDNIDIPIYKHN